MLAGKTFHQIDRESSRAADVTLRDKEETEPQPVALAMRFYSRQTCAKARKEFLLSDSPGAASSQLNWLWREEGSYRSQSASAHGISS